MGRARSGATMQDVELVDVAEVPRASAPRARRPDGPPHRSRRWLPVVLVVLLSLVVAEVVARAGGGDAPAAVPAGMVARVDEPPWARWRAPAARTDDVLAAGGVLVVSSVRDRRFRVTAYDEVSGAQVWHRDLGAVSGTRPLTGCPHGGADVGDVVLCVVEPPRVPTEPTPQHTVPHPAPDERSARVVALDAATGEDRGTWSLTGRLTAAERLGDDLVVLAVGTDGHARVGRYAGTDGARRWWYRGETPLRLREGIVTGSQLRVNPEFVLVQGWSATVLAAADGTEISSAEPTEFAVGALAGDVFATWSSGAGATVHDRRGRPLFSARALFPVLAATDGDPDDVLVLDEGGTLVGRSVPGGRELWRLDTYRAARMQAAGRLVLLGVDGYQVVDARTGTVGWESPSRVLMWWAPVTDGRLVLGPGRATDGAPTMEARRLADGHLEWVLPLEDGVRAVSAVGGHLVLRTRDEVVLLG